MAENLDLDWLISVDDHVVEPEHLWQERVPQKWRSEAPRIVRDDTGEFWAYEDKRVATVALSAVAGKEKDEFSLGPITYQEMRRGCYDSVARLEDMDRAGILASLCFPTFPRFCGQVFYEAKDRELGLLCVQAYNDWMIEEWCGLAPGRYIPMIIIPLWDPPAAAREIERCAALGARAMAFSENPAPLGLPTVQNPQRYWDPVWAAAEEAELVVCMHVGSSSTFPAVSPESPFLVTHAWATGSLASGTMVEWLLSPVFQRFPQLKIALSEGGIGWIPYFLEHAEQTIERHSAWASKLEVRGNLQTGEAMALEASEVDFRNLDVRQSFRDHVYGCFIEDAHGIASIDTIGVDNVMIETDYPHSDSSWPNCIDLAHKQLAGLSPGDAYKVLRGNAERVFRFTPADPPSKASR